jgi:hypothetical protein
MEGGNVSDESDRPHTRAGLAVNRIVPNDTPSRFKNHVVPAGLVYIRDFAPSKERIEYEPYGPLLYDVIDDQMLNRLIDMVSVPLPKQLTRSNRKKRTPFEKKRITIRKGP